MPSLMSLEDLTVWELFYHSTEKWGPDSHTVTSTTATNHSIWIWHEITQNTMVHSHNAAIAAAKNISNSLCQLHTLLLWGFFLFSCAFIIQSRAQGWHDMSWVTCLCLHLLLFPICIVALWFTWQSYLPQETLWHWRSVSGSEPVVLSNYLVTSHLLKLNQHVALHLSPPTPPPLTRSLTPFSFSSPSAPSITSLCFRINRVQVIVRFRINIRKKHPIYFSFPPHHFHAFLDLFSKCEIEVVTFWTILFLF